MQMVTQSANTPAAEGSSPAQRSPGARVVAVAAFAGALALVLLYALRGGGSYDPVSFQQNGLVVWWLLAVGIAVGLLPRTRPSPLVMAFLGALLAYAAWVTLSLLWTSSSELTTTEAARVLGYLGVAALISASLDRHSWRPAAAGLGVGGFVVCIVAVGSRLIPSLFGHDQIDAVLHSDRLTVPFGYWNSVGAWGAMSAVIGVSWSAHDRSRVRRAVALGLVPVAITTTYLTYSRTGIAALALAVLLVMVLSRNRFTSLLHVLAAAGGAALTILAVRASPQIAHSTGTAGAGRVLGALAIAVTLGGVVAALTGGIGVDRLRLPRRVARPTLGIAAAVLLIAAAVFGPPAATDVWHSFTHERPPESSANPTARLVSLSGTRYLIWKVSIQAFDSRPLEGTGAGTTRFYWDQHAPESESIRDAHNIWVQNLGELGLPGLILIVGVMVAALAVGLQVRRRARRSASRGIAAALVASLVIYLLAASVDWMWESTAITVLALAGIAALGARLGRARPRVKVPLRVVMAALALAAGAAQLPGLLSTGAIRRSQSAEAASRPNEALAWARAAVDAEPWSASAYEQLGLVWESAGQFTAAAQNLRRAIAREPQNYVHWLLLARVETERGRLRVALGAYDRARQLFPRADVFAQLKAHG